MNSSSETDLILMTKVFPYGHQEQYLLNELPFLVKSFRKVIIVPYDEFTYRNEENRLSDPSMSIFKINAEAKKHILSLGQKLKREVASWRILLFELFKGREPGNHLRFFKRNISQLRHSYTAAACLANHLKENTPEKKIFYNYWLHGGVIISKMCASLLNKNIPVISRAHAYDVYHKDWYTIFPESKYLFLGFESWKVHYIDKIFTISTHGYNHFLKLFPKLQSKFSISRLGVLSEGEVESTTNNKELLIVTCSNIDANKRVHRIPEIISKLKHSVRWVHFGKGNDEETNKTKSEIKKYGLESSCELKGFVPNAEVRQFYKETKVDLFLNLSRIEGIPVSLMEAASYGIPMLATQTVGNPEIVNNENGFLVDVDFDTSDIAKKLNDFFNDSISVNTKRANSRQTFLEKYDASKNYPEFINQILDFATTGK